MVEKIHIADIQHWAHGYFGLTVIGNAGNAPCLVPLTVSYLTNLAGSNEIKIQNFYDRVRSDITAKVI